MSNTNLNQQDDLFLLQVRLFRLAQTNGTLIQKNVVKYLINIKYMIILKHVMSFFIFKVMKKTLMI